MVILLTILQQHLKFAGTSNCLSRTRLIAITRQRFLLQHCAAIYPVLDQRARKLSFNPQQSHKRSQLKNLHVLMPV
jgi:hypothetical protein